MDKTKLKEDILKFRKITGITLKPYIDSSNRSLGLDMTKWKLINQPDLHNLGIDSTKDINAERPFNELIMAFERKGIVHLEKCDFETPLNAEYKCKSLKNGLSKFQKIRNQELARQIIDSQNKKIAIVFGGEHYYGVKKILDSIKSNGE